MMEADNIKFGLESTRYPWKLISETAVYAEKAGFDSFWMPDHIVGFGIKNWEALEAWSILSAIAPSTKRIRLGTCVGDIYRHHPAALAQMVATCDIISGGRVTLGMGIGQAMNLLPFGISMEKAIGKTREGVALIKKCWTDDFTNYEGRYYKLKGSFPLKPVQKPHPPIWIAANSSMTIRIAAELGDGWVPASLFPQEYADKLKKLRNLAKEAGRDWTKIEPAFFAFAAIAKSYEEARKTIALPIKMYFLTRPRILRKLGYDVTDDYDMTFRLVMNSKTTQALLEDAKQLPDDVIDKTPVFFGTGDDIIERIEQYVNAGMRHFVVCFFVRSELLKDNIKLFAEEVIPYFRENQI